MCNDERRPVFHDALDRFLDEPLPFGIEGTGCLVQHQNGRVVVQGAGNGEPLALTAGQATSAVPDGRGQTVGQVLDEGQGIGYLRHRSDAGGIRVGIEEGDVGFDRIVEQQGVLGHKPDVAPEFPAVELPEVHTVDLEAADGGIIQAQEQAGHRRLAAARRADQRHRLPLGHLEGEPIERGRSGPCISEVDVPEPQPLLEAERDRSGRLLNLEFGPQHLIESVERGGALLHLEDRIAQGARRRDDLGEHDEVADEQLPLESFPAQNEATAHSEQDGDDRHGHELADRRA